MIAFSPALPAVVRAMRPWQWVKNGVVLLPVAFGRRLDDSVAVERSLLAALAFCLLSSAAYLANDVADRYADAQNPLRRDRPVAAGELSPAVALSLAVALAAAGLLGLLAVASLALGEHVGRGGRGGFESEVGTGSALVLGAIYLALNVVYSAGMKRIVAAGAVSIALGFVLRVHVGGAAAGVPVSHWLTICTFLGALTVALGKRATEARFVLNDERSAVARGRAAAVAGAAFSLAYAAYTIAPRTVAEFGTYALLATAPIVALGVARFLRVVGSPAAIDPAAAFVRDPLLRLAVLGYVVVAAICVRVFGA